MSPGAKKVIYFLGVSIPLALLAWYYIWPRTPQTRLQLEFSGGFAYVSPTGSDNHLNIAYLNDWTHKEDTDGDGVDEVVCDVTQMGTELKVIRGTIVDWEPKSLPVPGSREFDLDNATVRFPAVVAANQALSILRDPWLGPATTPGDPEQPGHWRNLKWIPGLKEFHTGKTIHPNWPTMVNGRVELRGGELIATTPSNPVFKKASVDFRQGTQSKNNVSTTDKTIYAIEIPTAGLPGGNVEIVLTGATSGFTKLVIKPQGNRVELTIKGLHDMTPIPASGAPLTDFCTFYQLMQPRPPAKEWLTPYYIAATAAPAQNATGPGLPSPGFFCPGDWF
jgi:hypothetical protein